MCRGSDSLVSFPPRKKLLPAMSVAAPHFLLYAEAAHGVQAKGGDAGRWRFVLRLPSGETSLEAADDEQESSPERLELLAVIRGLEALSQPSRVTLLSGSRAIRRGLVHGLTQWRENDWQWERFGRLAPVKNGDLWQRLDRLLEYHALECGPARLEKADDFAPPPRAEVKMPPTRKRGGRMIRIDAPHSAAPEHRSAKNQITNRKSPASTKFRGKNFRNRKGTPASLRIWGFNLSKWFEVGHRCAALIAVLLGYWRKNIVD